MVFPLWFLTQRFVWVTMFRVNQIQSSFPVVVFSPPITPQSTERVDSLQGGFGGVKLKAQQVSFGPLRAQERVSVFRKPLCWNRGRCNHGGGGGWRCGGGVWATVKNGPGLKNGVMGCDRWGGSHFKWGEELQRLNPSNWTRRPRSSTRSLEIYNLPSCFPWTRAAESCELRRISCCTFQEWRRSILCAANERFSLFLTPFGCLMGFITMLLHIAWRADFVFR